MIRRAGFPYLFPTDPPPGASNGSRWTIPEAAGDERQRRAAIRRAPREGDALPGPVREDAALEDEQLLDRLREGDRSAFERLYERHAERMKSVAANLLRNPADAEDAVQECFVKVFRGASAFRGKARFSTWIYRILLNTCYDALRGRRRRPEPAPGEAREPESLRLAAPAVDHPLRLDLEESVARLDERPRTVFLLAAVEGFSHAEIGEILGVPEATSRTLLFEARRSLQRSLWREEKRA